MVPHLDRTELDAMVDSLGGDTATVAAIAAVYVAELDERIAAIAAAAAAGDAARVAQAAHALKSASVTVGAVAIADTVRSVELGARSGDLGGAPSALDHLRALAAPTVAALGSWPTG
jgi:HPt (histidine-containing phosphotransfer) domain-containing protein